MRSFSGRHLAGLPSWMSVCRIRRATGGWTATEMSGGGVPQIGSRGHGARAVRTSVLIEVKSSA
jgi:hypothetical protein